MPPTKNIIGDTLFSISFFFKNAKIISLCLQKQEKNLLNGGLE